MTVPAGEEDATSQAAHWLVALEEMPHDAELRARFEAWRAASPENAEAWSSTSDVYGLVGSPQYVAHRNARNAARRDGAFTFSRMKVHKRRAFLGAAVLAVAAALLLVFLPGLQLRLHADVMTSVAQQQRHVLPDGSTVNLAPDSAIELLFDDRGRGVRLLRGEALFEVRPDTRRPFKVLAGAIETVVLGTTFDVRLLSEGAVVSVREGKVRVVDKATDPPTSESLEAGQWVRFAPKGTAHRGELPVEEIAAWRTGWIIARDRAIADVIEEVGRSFSGAIVVMGDGLGRQRVTGAYNLADPVAALRAAVGVYGGSVRQVSPWLLVVSGS